MGEYEDRYPETFGRGEEIDPKPRPRHFLGLGLPWQARDDDPAAEEPAALDASPEAASIVEPAPPPVRAPGPPPRRPRRVEPVRRVTITRTPREICDDVAEQLDSSPIIDSSGISISVNGSEVVLEGTINSLFAIAAARALTTNVPGVSRVQVSLRAPAVPRVYETAAAPIRKVAE
jgi:hypothetical protein